MAFRRLVDLSLSERVDAVLIAGDLFDDERLSFQTERFLLEQLHRLDSERIPVVYATGNHDPGREGTALHRTALAEQRDRRPGQDPGTGLPSGVLAASPEIEPSGVW